MSYAIVRNEKLTRAEAQGICVHNDRKAKNHTNKEINPERTHLNCYLKKNELNYVKEFDKIKRENNLQGSIRSNSIIMCEMVFTSDEGTPHMHLIYIPVVHTKDKENRDIDKVCCRDFWKGRDSYRQLQNDYYKNITAKSFELERGLPSEETGAKHQKIEDLKKITNFENTKKVLEHITLELPEVPDINNIKLIRLNEEKVEKENNYLGKMINKFEKTIEKFIHWICSKFGVANEDNLLRDFQKEIHTFLSPEKQLEFEKREEEWEIER